MEAAGIPATPLFFYANAWPFFSQTLNVLQGELKSFCGGPPGLHTVQLLRSDVSGERSAFTFT